MRYSKKLQQELSANGLPSNRRPTPPGDSLREALEDYNLTQKEFAKRLGMSARYVNMIINNKTRISVAIAYKFSKLFGSSVKYWLNMQTNVDLHDAIVNFHRSKFKVRKLTRE